MGVQVSMRHDSRIAAEDGYGMLLAVDVGNTNTVIGIAEGDQPWLAMWRFSTPRLSLGNDWAPTIAALAHRDKIDLGAVRAVCMCSVVPTATSALLDYASTWLGRDTLVVSSALDLGITLGMDNPADVGSDRIANAVAAWHQRQEACIVVDLGTATKLEAIRAGGVFAGGAIGPGLGVMLESLTARAARLFSIPLEPPEHVIGTNTTRALQAGIVRGHHHLVSGLVRDFCEEMGGPVPVLITGGHAHSAGTTVAELGTHVPDLTLDGIRLIWRRNAR